MLDIYHKLRDKLNTHPIGAKERPEIYEILSILFSPDEAEVAIHLQFVAKPAEEIAGRASKTPEEVTRLCEDMANKGLVFSQVSPESKKCYMLMPMAPGVYEYPIIKLNSLKIDHDRLISLWRDYWEDFGQENHGSKTSGTRIVPIRQAIDPGSKVFSYDELATYVEKEECIAVANCACRLVQNKCNSPLETCFNFGSSAKFTVERGISRFISKEETSKKLRECEEAGLVHLVSNTADRITAICNCCSCCCIQLGAITRFKGTVSRPSGSYLARVNSENCTACGLCEEICPVEAIKIGDYTEVDADLCLGCGLCFSVCPSDAIHLLPRVGAPQPPAGPKELIQQMAKERGKLDDFMANLK